MTKFSAILALWLMTASVAAQMFIPVDIGQRLQPEWLIEMPDSTDTLLIADTANATLHRFIRDGKFVRWVDERYMSIGLKGTRKQKARDKKTPLGVYFVTERLDTTRLHQKYGVAAFPLDYPNAWDQYNERTGYGIWLHGVDRNDPERPALDTDGCLAVPNDALSDLAGYLSPLVTPVVIAPQMNWVSPADIEVTRLAFRIAIDQWQQSVRDGDLLAYLSLYSDEFQHHGMDKTEWSEYRLQVFESRQITRFEIQDLLLIADPAEEDLYLSRFSQLIETDAGITTTVKRLYWRRLPESRWQIVSEGSG